MLSPNGRAKLAAYKGKGDKNLPASFESGMHWSLKLLEWCLSDPHAFKFRTGVRTGSERKRSFESLVGEVTDVVSPKRLRVASPPKSSDVTPMVTLT
eukprot:3312058-Amphidinium_carterae.1